MKIILPPDLVARCDLFAERVCSAYRANAKPASLVLDMRGIAFNVDAQSHGRQAECAGCLACRLDPVEELDWTSLCDSGFDFRYCGKRIDVKGTKHGVRLIWPRSKNSLLAHGHFDVLLFMPGPGPHFYVGGWITREDFIAWHQVSGPGHVLPEIGTWYVERHQLRPLDELKIAGHA